MTYFFIALPVIITAFSAHSAVDAESFKNLKKIAKELQNERLQKSQRTRDPKRKPSNITIQPHPTRPEKKSTTIRPYRGAFTPINQKPFFDIPVTYNREVKKWIKHFQSDGRRWFKERLERSYKYLPLMKETLQQKGMPQDLAYIAMIESGFSAHAVSTAQAVGYWQFIKPTAERYGLKINWWIDERKDFMKSTKAAANYLGDLYKIFDSWYLTAAGYNMGETRLKRIIKKYNTVNYWELADKPEFPTETKNYIPKMIAALLISKAPKLYGFNAIEPRTPYAYDYIFVPGGTDLYNMATYLNVTRESLQKLNPELLMGFVPGFVSSHRIRIPKGFTHQVASYIRTQL